MLSQIRKIRQQLQRALARDPIDFLKISELNEQLIGLDPDWVEAAAFAWLAMRRLQNLPGNLPAVTGAQRAVTLGSIHTAS